MSDAEKPRDTEAHSEVPAQPCKSSTRNWYVTALNLLFAACLAVLLVIDILGWLKRYCSVPATKHKFIALAKAVGVAYLPGAVLLAVLLTHTFVAPSRKLCYYTLGPFVVSALAAAVYIAKGYESLLEELVYICYMIWYALAILWTGFTLGVSFALPSWAPLVLGRVAAPEAQTETNVDPSSSNV